MNKPTRIALLLLLLAGSATTTSIAAAPKKKSGGRAAFNAGDNTLGLAVGFGSAWSYGFFSDIRVGPAISVNYDHGIVDNVGPGTIGIGGVIGYQTTTYDYGGGSSYRARWTNIVVGVRGTYHLTILKDKNNKFDPYGGVTLGFRSISYDNDNPGAGDYKYPSRGFLGLFVGAKYNFTPSFGAFAESGYDISFLRLGLHLNF